MQIDHVIPRSQGGEEDVENGLVLCGPFSRRSKFANGCHQAKTDRQMLIAYGWLGRDQVEYLEEKGWVYWDDDGEPRGRGWKGFARRI